MTTAVACSEAGDADASGLRKQARPTEDQFGVGRYSKRLNDRIPARERTFNRALIKRITFQLRQFWIVQAYGVCRPRQRSHRMALFEGESHSFITNAPACADDWNSAHASSSQMRAEEYLRK